MTCARPILLRLYVSVRVVDVTPSFPKKRARSGETFLQFVEIGSGVFTNTITSVSKDNWLWIEKDL